MDSNDHSRIGSRLGLFHQQDDAPGAVFWHPRGATLYRVLETYMHRTMHRAGFREVRTPQLLPQALWERSGHLDKFGGSMFLFEDDERSLALKPMSCPGHVQVFNKRVHSYRDLPLRLCEFGACHRNEPSGAVSGLMRTRAFTQDDAHIFCAENQVEAEVRRFCDLLQSVYREFGFPAFGVRFSTRPAVRAGSDEMWDRAERALEAAAQASQLAYVRQPGEGAFYGPKLEFMLRDHGGREWQCGTIQLDFVLPERLDASYVDARSQRVRPVMIHHAVFGSLERFTAILLEHYQGCLPLWLAPEQIVVAPIADGQIEYAEYVGREFERAELRVIVDRRAESLARKVVDAREQGIPVFVAVGKREERDRTVTVRERAGSPVSMSLADAIQRCRAEARLG